VSRIEDFMDKPIGLMIYSKNEGNKYYVFCSVCSKNNKMYWSSLEPLKGRSWPIYRENIGVFGQKCHWNGCRNFLVEGHLDLFPNPNDEHLSLNSPSEILNGG